MNGNQFLAALEDIDDKFDIILESLSFMATKAQIEVMEGRLDNIEADLRFIKTLSARHDQQLESHDAILVDHETRLNQFEALKQKYKFDTA
jgi:hypothetical protein